MFLFVHVYSDLDPGGPGRPTMGSRGLGTLALERFQKWMLSV